MKGRGKQASQPKGCRSCFLSQGSSEASLERVFGSGPLPDGPRLLLGVLGWPGAQELEKPLVAVSQLPTPRQAVS